MDNNIFMIKDDLVTKSFLKSELKSEINSLREELTEQIKQSEARIKDEILTHLDKIMGLLRKLDEERTLGAYRQREHTDQLENHENRIKSLETKFLQ